MLRPSAPDGDQPPTAPISGLIGSTLLDAFVTPVLFARIGERPARRLLAEPDAQVP